MNLGKTIKQLNLGKTIKRCRNVKELTLDQLSEISGISVSRLCLFEKNKREPSIGAVESIANALGLPLSVLVFLAAQRNEIKELNAAYIETLSNKIMEYMDADANELALDKGDILTLAYLSLCTCIPVLHKTPSGRWGSGYFVPCGTCVLGKRPR